MNWVFSNLSTPFVIYNFYRYLLSFIAKDNTDEARFFAYDDEATKIIQKECQALVNPLHIKEGLPQAMNNILNKTYVLSVDLTDESCKSMKKGNTRSKQF